MVLQDLDFIFDSLDVECRGYLEWIELKEFDECLFYKSLDIEQIEASIKTVCGPKSNGRCKKEYFPYIVKELERRHFMEEKIKWDFRALDVEDIGRISVKSALFLFKAVHGDRFSQRYWNSFIDSRLDPSSDVNFDEVKLYLCNIPEFASSNGDQEYIEEENNIRENAMKRLVGDHKDLLDMQEDESTIAAAEQERSMNSSALKNKADNLLNRMDEIGMEALLEDDLDGSEYGGRAKDKVTASELLDAVKEKYAVLRERLLGEMLNRQVGDGMWQAMSEHEQHEKLLQLKLKEEKLRREGKLDTMAIHLPGARSSVEYNVFGLMGESISQLEKRISDEEEKIKESGLSSEEVAKEFSKKLDDKEKENSSTDQLLLDLNARYSSELDLISKKLQGLTKDKLLSPSEREGLLFALIQARLRGIQESQFTSASLSVGLTERIQPVKQDRSANDPKRHFLLSEARLQQHKSRRSYDGPVVPPKLFPLKSKLGRVDLALQLLQESERRYSLEREFLLSCMNSKESYMYRSTARKLNEEERQRQLSVLLAQWQGYRSKRREEKKSLMPQNRKCLEEACALKLESIKAEIEGHHHQQQRQAGGGASKSVRDIDAYAELLTRLQKTQDDECRKIRNVGSKDKDDLEESWKVQLNAILEEWFENVAVVLFGIVEASPEEEELLKALNNKYDSLRDKLLLDALMNQYGKSEWDRLSEQERQNQLARMRMLEKKLRREGKYDELSKLFGDAAANSDLLGKMLGENRQKYLDQLNERLRNRQRRIENGEDPDEIEDEEPINERPDSSTGNILMDLDKRFEDERDALLRKLREEQDRQQRERERQAELARLRLEARKAEREANFDGAALVLGLAERNKAALEDRLKSDRKRQEQLARERLAARRNKKKSKDGDDPVDPIEPAKDDLTGWQDCVLKELERKHSKERNLLLDLLQEKESEDLKQEAREMSVDERNQRLAKLNNKRSELDFSIKAEQEEHIPILEMALAIKYITKFERLTADKSTDPTVDDVIVSLTADLQQLQDEETRKILETLLEKTQPELAALREEQIADQKYVRVENVAKLVFAMDSQTSDNEIVKALDKKYDTLMDKLLLEALKKQMGDAEWAKMNEQERQRMIMKKRLEQKKLLKEGKLDEAARLLGEGFKTDANLKNLMGENRKKYQELLEERLRERRDRLARGEPVDDLSLEELPEEENTEQVPTDAKSLLEDLQKRYDDEKDELLARLQGSTSKYMDERERQAELARLRREQRRAQQEEKFGAAALVFGLAERNQNAAQERLKNDRARQEQLAKERLERLRNKRASRQESSNVDPSKSDDAQEVLIKYVDDRQTQEQMQLIEIYQNKSEELLEQFELMSVDQRQQSLNSLLTEAMVEDKYEITIREMVVLKHYNRFKAFTSSKKTERCSDDNLLVTILADLQQIQDKESEEILKASLEADNERILEMQSREVKLRESKRFSNIPAVLAIPEDIKSVDADVLVEALENKYDTLKDKLILDALEKQMGAADWAQMNERERQQELMKIKLQEKRLKQEGKMDEASRLMKNLMQRDTNLKSLLGATKEEQEKRLKERLEKRKQRAAAGMSEEQIEKLETEEDKEFEEAVAKKTTGNALEDLQKNFDAEKDALLGMLSNADAKLNNERKRQLELARLRREARKAQAEEKFDAAALVLGMAKTHQAAADAKMKGARARQEQLARERLQALKEKRQAAQQHKEEEDTPHAPLEDTDDVLKLQENVLSVTEKKHQGERNLLMKFIQDNDQQSDQRNKAKQLSSEDKASKLFQLKEHRKKWRENEARNPDEEHEIFNEATALKLEQLREEDDTKSDEEIAIKLLADLQDHQDKEAENLMKDLPDKDIATLKQLIQIQQTSLQERIHDNIAATLLGIKFHGAESSELENELVEALKEKYDAMKEKIYEEALKKKFGEDVWNAMSDKEKQEHLVNMRANDEFNKDSDGLSENLDSVTLPGMEKLIGQTRAKQDKRLKERMERRKRAKAEGKTEEEIRREEEEEDQKTQNDVQKGSDVIKDLQSQFQAEKDAILGMLIDADSKQMNERQRQLALAKLRRDKLKIKREQKYDGAALVMNLAKTNQAKKDASLENERGRQEQLARERIAALKRKREQQHQQNNAEQTEAEKLEAEEELDKKDDLSAVEQMQREGTVALQDAVLDEMDKKHTSEQDALMDMVQTVESDATAMEEANKLSDEERKEKLNLMSIQKKKLKEQSQQFLNSQPPENAMSEDEKINFNTTLASGREAQADLLKGAIALKLVDTKNELRKAGTMEESSINEEASVKLMADLQEKQTQESNAMLQAMQQCDNGTVEKLKDDQRKARRGGWMDNVASVVFDEKQKKKKTSDPKADAQIEKEYQEEEANLKKEAEEELAQFKKEMEEEKEKKLASMSEDEINSFMNELKAREEEKRKVIQAQIDKQRELAKKRIAEKRKRRDEKEFESDLASAMIVNAQKRTEMLREKTMAAQGAQKDSLEERLRRRREERKKRQEEEAEKQRQQEEKEKEEAAKEAARKDADEGKPESNGESEQQPDATTAPQVKKKKLPPLPGGGMKREKTVVEKAAEISDTKKQEMISMMMREQTTMAIKINKEQHRQEELVRQLREKRRKKVEARNEEAAKVLGLGARQKTIVEDKKKVERERQIDQIRERVNRIKQGRTQGTQEPKPEAGQTFANMAQEKDHDQMEKIAQKMEQQFKDGEMASTPSNLVEPQDEKATLSVASPDEGQAEKTGRGKLDEKTRSSIMKERQRMAKLRRGSQVPPTDDTDDTI